MTLEAIKYQRGSLEILDQLQLPHSTVYDKIKSSEDAWEAIHSMRVRGAPAIAIVAALGLAVDLYHNPPQSDAVGHVHKKLDYLKTSRPTAVNLGGAAIELKKIVDGNQDASTQEIIEVYITAAEQMLIKDVQDNQAIGEYGAKWILSNAQSSNSVSILTHCNTGSLATAGYGTALGVIRSVYAKGQLKRAYCTETRPYNQGSRLTAYELVHDKIPATLITDSMASALLNLKGKPDNIVAIVVGADRVAANGDTANKIGTYALAITAKHHGVRFLVAAPRTTIDMATANGAAIIIEQRKSQEMTSIRGLKINDSGIDVSSSPETISIAATGIDVWNPAFDITPANLIDGIVTEVGVVERDASGQFNLEKIMAL